MPTRLKAACVVAVAALHLGGAGQAEAACSKESWAEFERQLASAQDAFQSQNPAPILALWSHAPDVSLMGAFGGHEVGWSLIEPRLKWVSQLTSNGSHDGDEVLVRVVGSDVATIVQLEHITNRKPDGTVIDVSHLRVTHVARCEGAAWRVVHRHADPLTETKRPVR